MWTDITREQHAREGLRLPSDLTDREWAVLEPLLPARRGCGRPSKWSYRQIVEALLYLVRGGLPWRMLPPSLFAPMTTVKHYFNRWRESGLWVSVNHAFVMLARQAKGREASPTAGVSDSQSVKTTESGGPRGFDTAKKINGRKRHIATDTQGLLVDAVVHAADVQACPRACPEGPRRCSRDPRSHPPPLPTAATCLRRRRLRRREAADGAGRQRHLPYRDRQALRQGRGLPTPPPLLVVRRVRSRDCSKAF